MYSSSSHLNANQSLYPAPVASSGPPLSDYDHQQQYRPTSTNPFDFPPRPRPLHPESPPPPVPPRPHAQAASSQPQILSSLRPHPYPNSSQLQGYNAPSPSQFPTTQDANYPSRVPPHGQPNPPQNYRYNVPPMTRFPTAHDPGPNNASTSLSATSGSRPPPPPLRPPIPADSYFNNPWYNPYEVEGEMRSSSLGVPEGRSPRARAKSTVEQRPSFRPHASTSAAFGVPEIAFPTPEIPTQPSLGRASSATATVPVSSRSSAPSAPANDRTAVRQDDASDSQRSAHSDASSATSAATPSITGASGGGSGRRPSSGRGNSGVRGEFRFSPNLIKLQHMPSVASFQSTSSSYYRNAEDYLDDFASPTAESLQLDSDDFAKELSNLTLDMDENIRRFQKGELPEADQEWHRLVPEEALKALDDAETKRQGLIFELLKAEREYVTDLETMEEVFIKGLREASPPIMPESSLSAFVESVFGNVHEIHVYHQRMLESLFERQRETHPLIHSIADIVLATCLKPEFRNVYEKYIQQYPVSESLHQKELKSNPAYTNFLQSVSKLPQIKKRDIKIFLSRPLTRLVRLNMLIEQIHKRTNKDHEHPDVETLPIILNIISDCIKATQPGIETAEQKVKFIDLCENIVFQKGELVDIDRYDKERHLVYMGPVWRRIRSESGFSSDKWSGVTAWLLDNYFILTHDTRLANGALKKVVISRPIPLSFVRLASFTAQSETRREKIEDGGILDTFRSQTVPLYPFTLYHASLMKAYTLYVPNEALRKKWHTAFVDALGVHSVRLEGNQWFSQEQLVDGFFRVPRDTVMSPGTRPTGRVTSALPFATSSGHRFLAIGCATGIYVAPFNKPQEQVRVLPHPNPQYMAALQSIGEKVFNKFILHVDNKVISYSLELVARSATSRMDPKVLQASKENVVSPDQNVLLVRHVFLEERVLLIYASKKRLGSSVNVHAVEAIAMSIQRTTASTPSSFRPYGQPGYIIKEAYDIVALAKSINVCVRGGVVSGNPADFGSTASAPVPVIQESNASAGLALLKSKMENARSLGIVKSGPDEYLVIYEEIGCYMNHKGIPVRNYGFLKWETKAVSFAQRTGHILLISPRFIEIREPASGRLVQVIEGGDIRLLYAEPAVNLHDNIILAMRGRLNDNLGLSEKIVELVKTYEINGNAGGVAGAPFAWSEWDM